MMDNTQAFPMATGIGNWDYKYIAKGCYELADAMLKERSENA